MPVNLIPTKTVIPKRLPDVVHRPRLVEYLHENLARKLILIAAPAGYGKSTLLIDFASDTDLPVCWLTLDANDRDASSFLSYFVAALQQKFPQFGQRTRRLIEHSVPSAHAVASALVADINDDIPEYFAMVLDDWHLVSEELAITELMDEILRYLPENAHVIVAGRTLLRGPLVRLAAQGAVAGLGQRDLRFTPEEVREVLAAKYKLGVTPEQAARLTEEAEGWIAAILLSGQSSWRPLLAGLNTTYTASSTFFDYLAGEVFDRLPAELHRFICESAVPRQFTAELCDQLRLASDSHEWIDRVEARSLFLTRVEAEDATWYRYHHLFRDFALARFKRDDRPGYGHLQQRAAKASAAQHQPDEAIEHYLEAGALRQAAQVMDASARSLFIAGQVQTLARWVEQLPGEYRLDAPELLLYRAQTWGDRGYLDDALPLLHAAHTAFEARGDKAGCIRADLIQSWAFYAAGRFTEALRGGKSILRQIETVQLDDLSWQAQALRLVGTCYSTLGQWREAEQYLSQALTLFRRSPSNERRAYNLGRTLQDLANTLRVQGRLEEAAALQAESLELWREIGNPASLSHCLNNIGYDRYIVGDYEGALRWYAEALRKAEEAEDLRIQALVLDGMAATYRDRGEYERALDTYALLFSMTGVAGVGGPALTSWALDGLGHAHRLTGNADRALALFEQARSIARREGLQPQVSVSTASIGIAQVEARKVTEGLIELDQAAAEMREAKAYFDLARVLLWLAHARQLQGQEEEALAALTEMARLGRRLGCRPFSLAEGRRARTFLQWGVDRFADDHDLRQWLNELQEVGGQPIEAGPAQVVAPRLEVYALGNGEVWRDGQPLSLTDWGRSVNARELLFFLLEHSPSGKEEIGAWFWPDLSLGRMTSSFHATKYRVRRALGVDWVLYDNDRYLINSSAPITYDVAEFRRLAADSLRVPAGAERRDMLRQALQLYTGDYLADSNAEWVIPVRNTLHAQFFDTLRVLIAELVSQQQPEETLVWCQRGLEVDYYREDLHRVVMRCLMTLNRATEALAYYETAARRLKEELGTLPEPETAGIAERIRSGR